MNRMDEIAKLCSKVSEITDEVQKKLESMGMSSDRFIFSVVLTESRNFKVTINEKGSRDSLELDAKDSRSLQKFLNSLFEDEKKVKIK